MPSDAHTPSVANEARLACVAMTIQSDTVLANAIPCYLPSQVDQLEQAWFVHSQSFGLMQQAAWQMASWLVGHMPVAAKPSVLVVVGSGNNGGDGWLMAEYLRQQRSNWRVQVLEVAVPTTADAKSAKAQYVGNVITLDTWYRFFEHGVSPRLDILVDALFGIGLDRKPVGDYEQVIQWVNAYRQQQPSCQVISVDVPSGLNAATGAVYDEVAIRADISLCLIARKAGLHLQDSKEHTGCIIDIALLPVPSVADLYHHEYLPTITKRRQVSHKGSYGHVLIIGGNRLTSDRAKGQGMAGASLLAASSAFAVGAGKVTVACHGDFHGAVIAALPDAMSADLHQIDSIKALISQVDVVAIGMGLGRDKASFMLFEQYLAAILAAQKPCIIDADGLYHLATVGQNRLNELAQGQYCYFTPHSGEAARLLGIAYPQVDSDKPGALAQLQAKFGGTWLIKGAQTLVLEQGALHSCGLGNPGMATAGMGDCLSGVVASLLAQQDHLQLSHPLLSAVLIHAQAGDNLAAQVGEYALSANAMPGALGHVMQTLST